MRGHFLREKGTLSALLLVIAIIATIQTASGKTHPQYDTIIDDDIVNGIYRILSYAFDTQIELRGENDVYLECVVTNNIDGGSISLNGKDRFNGTIAETIYLTANATYKSINKFILITQIGFSARINFHLWLRYERGGGVAGGQKEKDDRQSTAPLLLMFAAFIAVPVAVVLARKPHSAAVVTRTKSQHKQKRIEKGWTGLRWKNDE